MRYQAIKHDNMLNGDGLRSVLWVSGCDAHCKNCFNPETWDFDDGLIFDERIRNEFIESARPDYISGITIVGGEPLHEKNIGEVYNIVSEFKKRFPDKTIWLYTGFTWEEIFKDFKHNSYSFYEIQRANLVFNFVDVLVDGPYIDSLKNEKLKWRGSSNQHVIDIKATFVNENLICNKTPILYCE